MSDQIHPALRAPQPNDTTATTPTPAPNAEASRQTSRPATATHTPEATAAPTTAPSATTFPPPQHATTERPLSLNEQLNNADRYWKFKGVFQVIIILSGLIGIGAVAWVVATEPYEGFFFEYPSFWAMWPSLITFSLSVIWCAVCIIVLIRRKRPVHAGLRVALDLLFWLGFVGTALLALLAYTDLVSWGEFGTVDASWNSISGSYYFTSNGTWVWRQDRESSVSYPRNCGSNRVYDFFPDCPAQDAFVNKLWQEKPGRVSAELAAVVCQFLSLVAHFIVFVWACVDCHRYNHSKVSQDAEKLAANIVQTMIVNGAIVPPPGQAHMKPIPWGQPGHYQLSSGQMYPMAVVYPQHAPAPQQYVAPYGSQQAPPLPPRPMAGPVNEKSEGPRYA